MHFLIMVYRRHKGKRNTGVGRMLGARLKSRATSHSSVHTDVKCKCGGKTNAIIPKSLETPCAPPSLGALNKKH